MSKRVYAVNMEGIIALHKMANHTLSMYSGLKKNTKNLQWELENHKDTLGPHKSSLDFALNEILHEIEIAHEPIIEVGRILIDVANAYQEIINNDRLKQTFGGDAGIASTGSMSYGGSADIASTGSMDAGGNRFGSFELDNVNGDFIVKGNNYEQYNDIVSVYGGTTYESFGSNPRVEWAAPSQIEGIHLGASELEGNNFWGRRNPEYTKESFMEIASHIPEVRSRMDAGQSLEEIKQNPSLAKCAEIYFEPSNTPRVIQIEGFYEFDSDGRHRILAAREVGHDIPVRVIGVKKRK